MDYNLEERFAKAKRETRGEVVQPQSQLQTQVQSVKTAAQKVDTPKMIPAGQTTGGDDPYNLQARFAKAREATTVTAPKSTLSHAQRVAQRDDGAVRANYAKRHPEMTGGEAGARTREINSGWVRASGAKKEAQEEVDRLQKEADAQEWIPRRDVTPGSTRGQLDRAKEELKRAEGELADWAEARYYDRNRKSLAAMEKDSAAKKQYDDAKTIESDMELIMRVANGGYEEEAEHLDYIYKKYGLTSLDFSSWRANSDPGTDNKVQKVYLDLNQQLKDAAKAMPEQFDYNEISQYERRVAEKADREERRRAYEEFAGRDPMSATAASVASVAAGPFQWLDVFGIDWGKGDPEDIDYVPPVNRAGVGDFNSAVRGTVSEGIKKKFKDQEWLGNTLSFLYQTSTSIGDSALSMAAMGPGSVYLMGTNAAVSESRNIIDRGGTSDQALWGGLAAGLAEIAFEKISVENLLKPKSITGWRSWVKETLKQSGVEASEEMFTEIANIFSDTAIMGEKSDFNQAVEQYKRQGLDEEEAKRKAYLDMVGQVALAGTGGAISGGVMGGAKRGYEAVSANSQFSAQGQEFQAMGQEVVDAIIQEGLDSDPSTESYKTAKKLQDRQSAGKEIKPRDLGRLYQENVEAIQAEEEAATKSGSTAVDTDPATHTPEQQAVIAQYQARTDETLKEVFQEYLDNPKQGFSRHNISDVSQRQAQDAQRLLGGAYERYHNAINSNGIQHILGEHGPEGTVDHSLGDLNDIARMGYVLDHYDDVQVVTYESGDVDFSREFRDKNDRPAPMLKFSKRVDGTYYVVEAIPESKHKKFWVVSAYMEKAEGGTQAPDAQSPRTTPNASLASWPSADSSIPQTAQDVNLTDPEARVQELERGIANLDRQTVERGTQGLGTQGQATVTAMYLEGQDAKGYVQGMRELYAAGRAGVVMESVDTEAAQSLNDHQRRAAYEAGRVDGAAQNRRKSDFAKVAGKEKGLVWDSYVEQNVDPEVASRLNEVARRLNVRVRFVDSILDGWANGQIVEADIRIAKDAEQPVMVVFGHEVGHWLEKTAPEAYQAMRQYASEHHMAEINALKALYAQAGQAQSVEGIQKELLNDDIGRIIADSQALHAFIEENKNNRTLLQKIADALRALWQKLTGQDRQQVKTAEESLLAALRASETQATKLEQAGQVMDFAQDTEGGEYSLKGEQLSQARLTEEELTAVQSIGRKSVNELTSEELVAVEPFARRYYRELGEKSPFFRAWFGDWRVNDQTPVQIATQRGDARGVQVNDDTGWNIQVSGRVFSETTTHQNQANRAARAYLPLINDIVKKAVLMDSHTMGKVKSPNSVMMHSLYAVADIGDGHKLLKLYVEEMNDPNQADTSKRAYQLQNIEISSLTGENTKGSGNALASFKTADIESVADLFRAVKARDKAFSPKDASKVVDSEGKPLVVYHGTMTKGITEFNKDFIGSRYSSDEVGFFFVDKRSVAEDYARSDFDADHYGEVIPAYLDIKKPLLIDAEYVRENGYGDIFKREDAISAWDVYQSTFLEAAREMGADGILVKDGTITMAVAFEPTQIKSATDNIGTFDRENPDIRFSLKGSALLTQEVAQVVEQSRQEGWSEEQTQEEIRAAAQRVLQNLVDEYGAIKPGEKRAREVRVPRKTGKHEKVSQTVRTILEAGATPESAVPTIEELTAKGDFSYQALSDKTAIERAEKVVQHKGWGSSLSDWFASVKSGTVSKENTAMGWALYNQAANSGDIKTAMDIIQSMVRHQRNAAQAVQATRILKQMDPETQLYGVQRSVAALQEELNQRFGEDKGPKLAISQELAEQLLAATDQEGWDRVMQDIYRDIGRQMPSSFADKWNAWRYLSMLGNVRTHVRNVMGNAGFAPVVMAKDMTATAIERAVYAVSGGKLERSKAMVGLGAKGRGLLAAAWGDYAKVQDAAMGGGKYSEFQNANQYIEEGRVIFKGQMGKPIEAARKGNSKALDVEDMWFSKPHYAYAMAQYCAAHGITADTIRSGDAKNLDQARAYAIREAQKATYRDTNALSQLLSGLGRDLRRSNYKAVRGAGLLVEGVLPFRKTPANILARGLEYSPLGLVKGLSYDLAQVKAGNMTGAEAIDHISAGLTGTGLLALGAFLAAQGLLRGKGPGDDKERELAKLQGHQDYSLEIGDVSITLDWLAPEVLPLFVGANLWETAQTDGELTMSDMLSAVSNVSDPLLEMSCLQSLNDIFDSVGYASQGDTSPLLSVVVSGATSYLTQGLPTIFGQGERVFETQRETTYTNKDAFLTGDMQYFLGKVSGKVPGWEFQQIPYIDAWGRTESTGGVGQRAFNNLLNPAYVSEIENSPMEEELLRLYEATGENVFPTRARKYFQVNGERRNLSADEYVDYATRKGQTARKVVEVLVKQKQYSGLEEGEKAEAVKDAYQYAEQIARKAVAKNYTPDSWVAKAQKAEKEYKIPVATYIMLRQRTAGLGSLKDKNGESIANSKGLQIMEAVYDTPGLGDRQRGYLFEALGVGKSIQHYNKALVTEKLGRMRKESK